jgi:hypothetical protein
MSGPTKRRADQRTFTAASSAGSEIGIERVVSAATDIVVGFKGLILIFLRQVRVNDICSACGEGCFHG